MQIDEENYLEHYGILRRSGRYPWGSGGSQSTRNKMFLDYVADMRKQGLNDTEIARGQGITTTQLRAATTIARNEQKQSQIAFAQKLRDKGTGTSEIARRMGIPESSARALLADGAKDKADNLQSIANMLKDQVAEKKYVDVGTGVENHINVTKTKLNAALALLKEEGYEVHPVKERQLGTGLETRFKILAPPGTTQKEVWENRSQIKQITSFSDDGGRTFFGLKTPISIDPSRVGVNYKEDGGDKSDGVIFVRPGVKDISLDKSNYAQVRVQVGDGHYLKGMAMYKDDLPDGVDLVFNTNKSKADTPTKLDAFKKLENDADNPFGAVIKRQIMERDADGKEHVTSAMNLVNEEGNWSDWSKTISTQMLSKQSPSLAKSQLDMTYEQRLKEFKEISSLTNPTVRRDLLEKFGDETDSAAVHLDAAGLKGQGWHAILPVNSLPPTQVYAPNFENGTRVALIRYPHGGTFEIPELTVNNRHRESRKLLGSAAPDAIGIHHSVAERLSGADFDGDTVLVIPNNTGKIKSTPALEKLKDFDPRGTYKAYEGMPKMTARQKGIEMGSVSNLITDMTLQGASADELSRAVRHSMVVIDAEKHNLNYKQSAIDMGIPDLKQRYQGRKNAGASTLISRATAEERVPDRKPRLVPEGGPIDKETGKRVFTPTGKTHYKTGAPMMVKSTKLAETDDAHTLVSGGVGTRMERIYADHSNKLKALANQARKESVNTPPSIYSPSAAKAYKSQVTSLNAKLNLALRNAPLERQAQIIANTTVRAKQQATPNMDEARLKKVRFQALEEARNRTGAKKAMIRIDQDEWDAIQAGAISDSKLQRILDNADIEVVRQLATPRDPLLMTTAKTNRAQAMLASGYTRAEVANQLGVSLTTLDNTMNEE